MIVVFGSINIDIVIQVDALPRAGETVLSSVYNLYPGGKGANTAVAAARAGADTMLFGQVGRDGFAEQSLVMLREAGVGLDGVDISDRPTGCATIWVDSGGENAIVVASGANLDARSSQVPDAAFGPETLVALQMEVPVGENWAIIERAKAAGSRVLLNLAPAGMVPETVLRSVDYLVTNEIEAAMLAGELGLDAGQPTRVPRLLAQRYGLTCIVTLGGAGALAFGPQGGFSIPALPIAPIDTTAAGDAFCGGLAAALDNGFGLYDSLCRASAGAGLACRIEGAQSSLPDHQAIEASLPDLPEGRRLA
ncbi:MAG: ribokinase [Alphaproteobacteria bacterium]|nr:ribokinase [Alphaproteobacteria bacterium]